jgi:hypothetical protein
MTTTQIKAIQQRICTTPDGFWGPKSIAACVAHLRKLMPANNPWPATNQSALTAFYGAAGDESKLVNLPVSTLGICYAGAPVRTIRCHDKVSASLLRVLQSLSQTHPTIIKDYNGCYNFRNMRGGSAPSLHARGAAIDFCASRNGLNTHWPTRATMPLEVMETFAKEGWKPAGAFWGRDAMHFEATR